ncbi:MAG: condensation domain-containing protein [Acidobacteriota bacterium]
MSLIAEKVAGLSPRQREMLLERLKSQPDTRQPSVPETGQNTMAPLTAGQERMWLLEQLEEASSPYAMPVVFKIDGPLDRDDLRRALNLLVERHAVLRTQFPVIDDQPMQVVQPAREVPFATRDLQQVPASQQAEAVRQIALEEIEQGFDLATGPLIRAVLMRLTEQRSALLVVLHHIVCDGWSLAVLRSDLIALYASARGETAALPPLPSQYVDYARWQQRWLEGPAARAGLEYWERQLADAPAELTLPFDRPRPSVRTSAGDVRAITLSAELDTALREQAQSESVSLFILLLTAYKVLLHRLSGATDLLVGTPVANRERSETQGLIGLFLNTVVLRSDLTGDPSFSEVLKRVREVALEAYDRPELPFDRVVDQLKPERSLSLTPLFQTMFVLEAQPSSLAETQQALNLELSSLSIHNGTSQFDLSLLLHPEGGGLRCSVEFSTDVFDGETIERLLGHWRTLLEGVVQDPNRRISELPIVDEAQRRRIFSEWNQTATEMPAGVTLQALFEERVSRAPEARAVELGGSRRTYAELNQEANRLAHYLKQQGAGPEVRIGLLLDRSIEWVTSLLAIFKAGAAYVPLDPLYPQSRLVYMARDAGVSRILSHSSLAGLVRDSEIPVVCLDHETEALSQCSSENPAPAAKPEHLAYSIYTSGSTGRSKGVLVDQRALINHCLDFIRRFELRQEDRVLQFASLGFDVAAEEMIPTLLSSAI